MLTGSIFNQTQILDIWKQAIGVNGGVYGNADIYNPEKLTDLVFKYMNNTNLSLSVGYDRYKEKEWPLQMVAYRIRVPADPYHFTLGSLNNNIIYNPGWTTGEQKIRPIYLKRK